MKTVRISSLLSVIVLAVLVFATASPLIQPVSGQAVDEPWPMFGQSPDNNRATDGSGPKNLGLKWKFRTDGVIFSSAVIGYGNVYFGSMDGNYYCLDAQSGTLKWKFDSGGDFIRATPAIYAGKVYTGDDSGYFHCSNTKLPKL